LGLVKPNYLVYYPSTYTSSRLEARSTECSTAAARVAETFVPCVRSCCIPSSPLLEARDSNGSFALKKIYLDYVPYCALLTYIAGRNHYHLLPSPPLAPLQTATASSHRRSYWWNHTWSLSHDAHTRIPKCHIPSSSNAHTQSRCQSGVDLVSLSRWFGSQYEDVPHELACCAKCGVRGDDPSFRIGMRYCLGSLQPIQN
jgi:hypothetical protein